MFIPHLFKETNEEEINHIIDTNPFGTLITTIGGKPIATHIPMLRRTIDGTNYMTGHSYAYVKKTSILATCLGMFTVLTHDRHDNITYVD